MGCSSCIFVFGIALLLATTTANADKLLATDGRIVKTKIFYSPPFYLSPGSVSNKFYGNIDFPRGHIALKSLDAEVVDERGDSVPLHETYLHHWLAIRYFSPVGSGSNLSQALLSGNSGVCKNLVQFFGLGSETRETPTWVPDPYGMEFGNPKQIPLGHEEKWLLNVHAIDTRGVVDKLGCTECRCSLYNVTTAPSGKPLSKDYVGGLLCCEDQAQCQLKQGFTGEMRKLYLKYTVKWLDWDDTIVPVKTYVFDVTYSWMESDGPYHVPSSQCKIEYTVEPCSIYNLSRSNCLDTRIVNVFMPSGGEIVYGVAHQHSGGSGSTLYSQNGKVLCSSIPLYGSGVEAGNEAGYIVGMSTCYPRPGSAKVSRGEILVLESKYNSSQLHTGVMGLFYLLVVEQPPESMLSASSQFRVIVMQPNYTWVLLLSAFIAVAVIGVMASRLRRNEQEEGYQSLVI